MTQVLGIGIAAAVVLGLLYVLRHPEWAIVMVILLFPLEQLLQSYLPVLVAYSWIWNVVTGSVALAAAVTAFMRGQRIFMGYWNRASILILCIYLIAIAGLVWTPARESAIELFRKHWPYVVLKFFIAPLLIKDLDDFRRIMVPTMVLGSVIAILIIVNPSSTYYSGRLQLDLGMYDTKGGNPLELGSLGATIALIAALMYPPRRSTVLTVIRITAFIMGLGLAIGSGSRGQVLAAMVTGVLFFPIARRLANPRQFFLGAMGIGVLGVGFFVAMKLFIGDQNRERWDIFEMIMDIGNRFDMVWALAGAYLESPGSWVLGLGPNAFTAIGFSSHIPYVHNIYAEILCEEGLIAFIMFMAVLLYIFQRSRWMILLHRYDPVYRATFSIIVAVFAYQALLSGKQGTFLSLPAVFLWLLLIAKVAAAEAVLVQEGAVVPAEEPDETNAYDEYEDYDEGFDLGGATPALPGGGVA